ncbi:MAG: tRNA uridine-5-carboxymethylaminomethyl(34) synthesis GTPase MnmE [Chloroflexi bacterium]|nr:tRNA uridine-5-carboxymethylaminomethyl(34) synthesis GTPase MnmE [Chloroflexota bacterium]
MYQDTIAAIATPLGEAALGIVRLSGAQARPIAQRVFSGRLRDRRVVYGHLRDPATGELVDEAMATYLAAPRTYTREDMVDLSCHGSGLLLQRVLQLLLREGARAAEPGEFTLRAFLHGRIDLAQAEAVLDVIQARTQAGLQIALQALEGRLSERVRAVRRALLEPLAYCTALVDFPEDEVEPQDVAGQIAGALAELEGLLRTADQGMVYRQGVRAVLVGRPNVGKSSLLNRLLGRNRAIVTELPGTTRDTLEELANLHGVPFLLTDTAGITESDDPVERLGVERSRLALAAADLALLVLDASQPLEQRDYQLAELLDGRRALVVANKVDLPHVLRGDELGQWPWVWASALLGKGMEELEARLAALVLGGEVPPMQTPLVSNPRHKAALERALQHAAAALEGYRGGIPADLVTIDLTSAVAALGEITGETVEEDLLELIFSRFCVGK